KLEPTFVFDSTEGIYKMCESSNLHLNDSEEAEIHEIDLSVGDKMYAFTVYLTQEEIILPHWLPRAFISVHSPFVFNSLTLYKHEMKPGRNYNINIRLEEEHRLPSPYPTNCMDYGILSKNNNKNGPRSQQVCKQQCWKLYEELCSDCHVLPELFEKPKICSREDSPCKLLPLEEIPKCEMNCKADCLIVDLAGYVICALFRPKGVLWDLDRGPKKASPVFEHSFRQTTSVQASMCEWSSYPAGREMGLPRSTVIQLGVQHYPECPHTSQSSCYQSQDLTDPGQYTRNTPHHYASTTKLNCRQYAVTKETFAGHPPNPDASIRLPDCKARFITPKKCFTHVHSPMTGSSTPLQSMLRILWSDVWLMSGCTTMGSQVF
ncbi:uncharacterized protein TNCV_2230981, partial [Trichonephila clavipes]